MREGVEGKGDERERMAAISRINFFRLCRLQTDSVLHAFTFT